MSERLRAFVRDRVHKDSDEYRWGAAAELAVHLQKPASWVSHYIDDPPQRNADVDAALAICDFFSVSLYDFRKVKMPPAVAPPKKVAPAIIRAVRMLESMDERRRRRAVALLADLFLASVRERRQRSPQPKSGTTAATKHTTHGKRRDAE